MKVDKVHLKILIKKFKKLTTQPPPTYWFSKFIFSYLGKLNPFYLLLAIYQQSRWTLINLHFYYFSKKFNNVYSVPKIFLLKACCLNTFTYYEIALSYLAGLQKWSDIKYIPSRNSSKHFNNGRIKRLNKNNRTNFEIKTLRKKTNLLEITPKKFLKPYFHQKLKETNSIDIDLNWLYVALVNEGIIVKPNSGHGALNTFHCIYKERKLNIVKIFKKEDQISLPLDLVPSIEKISNILISKEFFDHYDEDVIFQPYIENIINSKNIYPSIVIRVVTYKKGLKTAIFQSWAEVPLENGDILYLKEDGFFLPVLSMKENMKKDKYMSNLISYILDNKLLSFEKCHSASIEMHNKFTILDQIAWDWIPTNDNPKLLEGNHNFDLFIPNLFKKLS